MSENIGVTQNLKLYLPEQADKGGPTSVKKEFLVDIIPSTSRHLRRIKVFSDNQKILEFSFVTTPPYDIGIFESSHPSLTAEIVSETVSLLKVHFGFSDTPLLDLVGRKHDHLNLELFKPSIRVLTSDMVPSKPFTVTH